MSDVILLIIILAATLGISGVFLWRWLQRITSAIRHADPPGNASNDDQPVAIAAPAVLLTLPTLDRQQRLSYPRRIGALFFVAALVIYLLTHFIGLTRFPITFFADEAAQTVLASDLVQNGFKHEGTFLPTYFLNVDKYSLSVTVYSQVLPYLIFGKSILVTRGTSVLVGMIGAVAVCTILKEIFRNPYWWSGALLLSVSPGWFMHSRTAFEAPTAAALYAAFLLAYLLYLYRSPKYFALAVLTGALTFYSYNPARVIIMGTVVLLGLSDLGYHRKNKKHILRSWWLILLCVLPYIRFQINHPFSGVDQLYLLNSYWIKDIPFYEKALMFIRQVLMGLDPRYWFFQNQQDLIRHIMKGYGHLLWITLPFALLGIYVAIKHIRIPAYRVLIVALVCSLFGAAIVAITVTRALPFIIPVTILTGIGLSALIERFVRSRRAHLLISIVLLIASSSISLYMTGDALKNGAHWFKDYGLHGMQYGASEVFDQIEKIKQTSPDTNIILSPYWANGVSVLARFFMDDLAQLQWGVIGDYLAVDYPIEEEAIFIMLPQEYEMARESAKVKDIRIDRLIHYPDDTPGFYFCTVTLDEIDG